MLKETLQQWNETVMLLVFALYYTLLCWAMNVLYCLLHAVIIGGVVVGLLFTVTLVMFIVYRMRKKDEGSYALDEPKASPTVGYTKTRDREFFAWIHVLISLQLIVFVAQQCNSPSGQIPGRIRISTSYTWNGCCSEKKSLDALHH